MPACKYHIGRERNEGEKVVSYCHYCQEGLLLGGADASHLAMLLFES